MTIFGRAPFNRGLSSFLPFSIFFALLLVAAAFLHGNAFAGTVTAATGGSAISADTTSAAGGSGAWTSLSGPSYQETVNGDLNNGTIILTVPTGFEFNTGVTVSVVLVSGASNAATNMNGTAVGGNVATTANGTLTVTATAITFAVTSKSKGNVLNKIEWQGIQVRPTSGSPLASGNITPSGTSGIATVATSTNFGTLTEVAGSAMLAFVQQPSDALVNATISPSVTVQVRDKFGNLVSGSRSVTVTLSSGTGVLSGTATQTTNAAGLATFGDLSINLAGTKALTAASTGVTSAVSNSFIINNPVPTTTSISPASKNIGDLPFVMTVNGTNFVPTSVVRFAGSDRVTTYISSTQLTVAILTGDLSSAGTFAITVFNPTPGGGLSNAQTFTVVSAISSFDAVEVGAARATELFTKLAGTAFSVDLLALDSANNISTGYAGTVTVKLVDASTGGGVCGSMTLLQDYGSFSTFSSGRKTVSLTYANAVRNAKIRINDALAGVTSCATDSFAIRPTVFTITSTNATNSATSGTPVIKAGGGSFNLTATAVTGYDGTPSLDATKVIGSSTAGTLSGSFGAASSGVATGNAFTYSEVGNFGLSADAVYDTSFTSIDQGSGCLASSTSNTLSGGKYGCWVGSSAVAQATGSSGFGRFIPDHFNTTVLLLGSVPMTCPTGLTCPVSYNGFVYAGQPFSVQVTAKNASDVTTVNYNTTTGFAKSTTLSAFGALGTITVPTGAGALGVASVTAFAAGTLTEPAEKYTFSTIPTAPTNIYIRASDGEASSLRASNPTTTSVEGGVQVVSGRMNIPNVYGSELLPLPMTATVQYYSGTNWVTSTTDSTTAFNSNLSTAGGNLVATVVSGLGSGVVVSSPGTSAVVAGVRTVTLSAPLVPGSANISLNAPTYLPSSVGRATFGIYKNPLIYRRENY